MHLLYWKFPGYGPAGGAKTYKKGKTQQIKSTKLTPIINKMGDVDNIEWTPFNTFFNTREEEKEERVVRLNPSIEKYTPTETWTPLKEMFNTKCK